MRLRNVATWAACAAAILAWAGPEVHAQLPPRLLAWEQERLVVVGTSPFPEFEAIVEQVNRKEFDAALAAIGRLDRPDQAVAKALLAMAVAGHLERDNLDEPIRLARAALASALEEGADAAALRLRHELELFEVLPGQGMPTYPQLLPARDMIRNGDLEAGRGRARDAGQRGPKDQVFVAWSLAGMFEGQPQFETLRDDTEKALDAWLASGSEDKRIPVFNRLLQESRQQPGAGLIVPADSVLYPKVLLSWLRAYYWWWKQMGERQRPMSKQGFQELLQQMQARFPQSTLVRMYGGEAVPWGEEFTIDPATSGAPEWACKQRELRGRVDHVVEWWFANRQKADGSLGGGWEDDCETLRRWSLTAFACGNEKIEAGIRRLVDGIWNSGEFVNGYDRQMKDVEHSSEMAADSSIMVGLDYGDPLQFERFLQTAKTTAELHTAVNKQGHRHFRSINMSATAVREDDVDTNYHGRAMRPAAMIAWYSGIPRAVDLLHGWARAWCEDTVKAGETKPAGILPAVVRFEDCSVDGEGHWVARRYGELYWWQPGNHDMVLGHMLGAWLLTGDDHVLDGLRAQLRIMREHLGRTAEPGAAEGSLEWAAGELAQYPQYATWYRVCTGDRQFDDLVREDGPFGRYLVTGDSSSMAAAHESDLAHMRYNLPMITSEVRGTDRVDLRPWSLLPALTGSSLGITEVLSFWVTWREVGPDFTALVRRFDGAGGSIWAYSFGAEPSRPKLLFWRLEPGRYVLRTAVDANGDGEPDGPALETIPFECQRRLDSVRFQLPARTLCLVHIERQERLADLPRHMPDLAIMPRDLTLAVEPKAGQACQGRLVVHNIGAADAHKATVEIAVVVGGERTVLTTRAIDTLAFPADLVARTATVDFEWTPQSAGAGRLEASVQCGDGVAEICLANNRASVAVAIAQR